MKILIALVTAVFTSGQVCAIDLPKADNAGNKPASLSTSALTSLCNQHFCVEEDVMTPDGRTGTIIKLSTKNTFVSVQEANGSVLSYDSKNLTRLPNLKPGDAVVTSDLQEAVVVAIFEKGATAIKLQNGQITRKNAADLGRTNVKLDGITFKDQVVSSDLVEATVLAIFPNHAVAMKSSDGQIMRDNIDDVGRTNITVDGITFKDKVISSDLEEGKVIGIFPSGAVAIKISNGQKIRNNIADVGHTDITVHGFTAGDKVLTSNLMEATILGIFRSGAVGLRTNDGKLMRSNIHDLGHTS